MLYNLIKTETNEVIKCVDLTKQEVSILNYAYAMNTMSKMKYVKATKKNSGKTKEFELNLFNFQQPI